MGEISTHTDIADDFAERIKETSNRLKNGREKIDELKLFDYSSGSTITDIGSTVFKLSSAMKQLSSSTQVDGDNVQKINQTFAETDKQNEKRFN
ncbi:DUF3130 family protein [Carnobacterium divergens]|uniref:Type VII secretion effector n=1 Tax=Carnobacterium divergens DSM 20623 TaxID=1449336 RepID=A0A0R2HYA3_CARDV|nr:DUF3130 family protein [Carnobacterium divergens]KRN57753.1 hypothetical protein IV74_GL001008 [Carnobacterium divergens DSM 20623]MDO0874381.1 DUF3130 domain-containing protein [Carnobacterium divergens]SUX21726.1 Uncharacterised protein [Carnobacterium divergens]